MKNHDAMPATPHVEGRSPPTDRRSLSISAGNVTFERDSANPMPSLLD